MSEHHHEKGREVPAEAVSLSAEIAGAFRRYDEQVALSNIRVGCVLGMVLMPLGFLLDYMVYPRMALPFLGLRLLSSVMIGLFLGVLATGFGRKHHRSLGLILLLIPATFMALMIYQTEGAESPYYAGLNLVLLVVAFVLRWTFWESLLAVLLLVGLYLGACLAHGPLLPPVVGEEGSVLLVELGTGEVGSERLFLNNLYFLLLTGIIVVTGNYFLGALRYREFASRYELDRNRRELEESNLKLKELDRIKSRFFANISHELRTPLTLLLAPLETLLHRHSPRLPVESRELLRTMHTNSMRLLKLINDLLDLVRLDSGVIQIRREPVSIVDLVRGLAVSVSPVAQEKQIRVEAEVESGLGTVLLDRDKVEKAVLNLMFNAIKFTPSGGRVGLSALRRGEELLLQVADTGIGISREHLGHVFDRFWQEDSSARRRHHGVGIGLALVKELTEAQGGGVAVESQEGRGTVFSLRLPWQDVEVGGDADGETSGGGAVSEGDQREEWLAGLYRRAELAPAEVVTWEEGRVEETAGEGARPLLLIADDEPDMRGFLRSQLRGEYRIEEVGDGERALEAARRLQPELILLDMMMPEKDGLEVCRELRERSETRHVPIIMLTARVDEETKLAALSSGANDFLLKPFSTTELHVRVRNLVASHQLHLRLEHQNELLSAALQQLKEMQSQLVQVEKLTSLGRLSAGIIHEINNPLNFAATGLYALRGKQKYLVAEQQGEYEEILHDIEEGISRVRNIVSDLRTFTFPNAAPTDEVRIVEAVGVAMRFLSHEWDEQVRVVQEVPANLMVHANRNKLVQVLVNLLQNSLDALRQKAPGTGSPLIEIRGGAEAEVIRLRVRDNGPGIESVILDKIFDPFFTTKEVGKGMGLGLSICYRIVQEAGGRIDVETEVGRYTEFNLVFPRVGWETTVAPVEHAPELTDFIEHGH